MVTGIQRGCSNSSSCRPRSAALAVKWVLLAPIADSMQTLLCTCLSGVVLVGLVVYNALGWWWADSLAGLIIAVAAIREGRQAWRDGQCCRRGARDSVRAPPWRTCPANGRARPGSQSGDALRGRLSVVAEDSGEQRYCDGQADRCAQPDSIAPSRAVRRGGGQA